MIYPNMMHFVFLATVTAITVTILKLLLLLGSSRQTKNEESANKSISLIEYRDFSPYSSLQESLELSV